MSSAIVPAEIVQGPEAIRDTIAVARASARSAARHLRDAGVQRIHVIGNGTSYHSSLAASTLYGRHARADDPIVIPSTAGAFRTYPPDLRADDAIVGISASGEFRDVIGVAESLRDRVPFVGIVHVPGSTLTRLATDLVLSGGGPSSVPVMTKTFSSTLVATELVLLELLGEERADPVVAEILQAAAHAAEVIAAARPMVDDLAQRIEGAEHLFVVGSGLAHVAALEAALKLKEMAIVHAEGTETWEMASGVSTIVGPGSVVVALAPAGPGRSATADVVSHAAEWGATVIEVGPEPLVAGSTLFPLPAAALEDHAPLTSVPPIALLAYALARRRGHDPDRPDWVARYHSQGLRHIVGV